MFVHRHPYPPFIPRGCEKLIVGTLPPPRFSTGELRDGDVDFCYGSRDGLLWPILERIYDVSLEYANTQNAIIQRKKLLAEHRLGVCDIVQEARREKVDASDHGMSGVQLRDMVGLLEKHPTVHTLLFTGGNSKNGPEYHFRKLARTENIKLKCLSEKVPRRYQFTLPGSGRRVNTVSLTAPSGSANRAVGSMQAYKRQKTADPTFNTLDFRVLQYSRYFN